MSESDVGTTPFNCDAFAKPRGSNSKLCQRIRQRVRLRCQDVSIIMVWQVRVAMQHWQQHRHDSSIADERSLPHSTP